MDGRFDGLRTDLCVRSCGMALGMLAWFAIQWLARIGVPPPPACPSPAVFALAAAGFVLGSAGAGLVVVGRHLFDPVRLSDRWRKTPF